MLFQRSYLFFIAIIQICLLLPSCHDSKKTSPDKKRKIKQIQTQVKRLDSIDPDEVNNAIQELRQIGASAVPILIEALEHDSVQLRSNSARALPVLGASSYQAIPALVQALSDKQASVREQAAFSLGLIGALTNIQSSNTNDTLVKQMLPALIITLDDESIAVRSNAASALGMLGEIAIDSVPVLVEALGSTDSNFRADIVAALGLIGEPKNIIIPKLTESLNDESPDVRQCASFHLERLSAINSVVIPP